MTVYVDDARIPYRGMKMCHMLPDATPEGLAELHEFAARLGLQRSWFQSAASTQHYDICLSKRKLALRLGAVELRDKGEVVAHIRRIHSLAEQKG